MTTTAARMFRALTMASLLALPTAGAARAAPCPDLPGAEQECVADSPWYAANRLEIRFESEDGAADWLFELASGAEYRITLDERLGGEPERTGVLMMVGGEVMITRGMDLTPETAFDRLDTASLIQKLVLQLLQHVFAQGPEEVFGIKHFRVTRDNLRISAATPRARTDFAPPWSVTGFVDNGSYGYIAFDMEFEAPDVGYRARFTGRWEARPDAYEFRDAMLIEDWLVWPLEPEVYWSSLRPGLPAGHLQIDRLGKLRRIIGE